MRGLWGLSLLRAAMKHAGGAGRVCTPGDAVWQSFQRAGIVSLACNAVWGQVLAGQVSADAAVQHQRRHWSEDLRTTSSAVEMPEGYYHKIVDHTLDDLLERLEYFVEELDIEDADVEYSQGVLTVRLGELGTYVINKQTPNRQIWMSSPISGPVRYDWAPGKWVYRRDGHDLHTRLSEELKQLTGHDLDLSPCFACGKLNTCSGEQCDKGM